MNSLFILTHWLNDPTVRQQYTSMALIIAIAKIMFGLAMIRRGYRKGGISWPVHWNLLVGLWILSNGIFFGSVVLRLQYNIDLIYLLRTLQIATIMTVWTAIRWATTDEREIPNDVQND